MWFGGPGWVRLSTWTLARTLQPIEEPLASSQSFCRAVSILMYSFRSKRLLESGRCQKRLMKDSNQKLCPPTTCIWAPSAWHSHQLNQREALNSGSEGERLRNFIGKDKKKGGFGKQSAQAAISAADEEALANANQLQNSDKFSAQKEVKNIKKETNNFSNREKRKWIFPRGEIDNILNVFRQLSAKLENPLNTKITSKEKNLWN